MSRYKHHTRRAMRVIDDALLDEDGLRWDRCRSAEAYYQDAETIRSTSIERWIALAGRAAPREVDATGFWKLTARWAEGDAPLLLFEHAGRRIAAVETSDC